MDEVRTAIRRADGVVVLTGAGVSAESGVPTFRDRDGIWARYDFRELATPQGFARDPRKVWEWYGLRRRTVLKCRPNAGHVALARWMRRRTDAVLVTQNVDGLHTRTLDELGSAEGGALSHPTEGDGSLTASDRDSPRDRVLELHGNLFRSRCSDPNCAERWEDADAIEGMGMGALPRCPYCEAPARPDVVWFGEMLDEAVLDAAFESARTADLCLVVGTSAVVHPAASVPMLTLREGGDVVEVNPEPTPLSDQVRWSFRETSATMLPLLLD